MPVPLRRILGRLQLRKAINNPFPHWPIDCFLVSSLLIVHTLSFGASSRQAG